MTASCSILTDLGAIPLSRRSLKRLLPRPCASLTPICASRDGISSGSSYLRQKSSIESFPQNPGTSRAGRRRRDFSYSESASRSSSSDIFGSDTIVIRGQREEVSEIVCELSNLQTNEMEAGLVRLVAGPHPEGNVDAASDRKRASVQSVTTEMTGEPGAGSGFVTGCVKTDGEGVVGGNGVNNGELGVGVVGVVDRVLVVNNVLVVDRELIVDRVLVVGKELVVSREEGVVG